MSYPRIILVEMEFGSTLYGTRVPTSDLDIKGVFKPSAEEILLGRMPAVLNSKVEGNDRELYSLIKFFDLCASGQTVAMDMLFTPERFWTGATPVWRYIVSERNRLLTSKPAGFLGYCRQQAAKYGVKGNRLRAVERITSILHAHCVGIGVRHLDPLETIRDQFEPRVHAGEEFWAINDIEMPGGRMIKHLSVCGRQVPYTASIKTAYEIFTRLHEEYGARARAAATNDGIDWKALMHAVRIGNEAVELLKDRRITFPRPEAAHLISIRTGALPYQQVAEEIEQLVIDIEAASNESTLPSEVDRAWIEKTVYDCHWTTVALSSTK